MTDNRKYYIVKIQESGTHCLVKEFPIEGIEDAEKEAFCQAEKDNCRYDVAYIISSFQSRTVTEKITN